MTNFRVCLFVVAILFPVTGRESCGQLSKPNPRTFIEHVTTKPVRQEGGLGTIAYKPSKQEEPFFAKLADNEKRTGGLSGDYDITKKNGKYVGWFGIVRGIVEDKAKQQTTLTVEHKYFDGLTDTHIQAVSFNGSGDFVATLRGVGLKIKPLSLVKVYGQVSGGKPNEPPHIEGVFVRDWDWGTFTFLMASGKQRGSEQWRKLNRVKLDDIYDPYPTDSYYRQRLGDKPGDAARRGAFRRRAIHAAIAEQSGAGNVVGPVIEALLEADLDNVRKAVENAQDEGADSGVAAVLAEGLKYDDVGVRYAAAWSVRFGLASPPQSLVRALIAALRDESEDVRAVAATALGQIGDRATESAGPLLEITKDSDPTVRANACRALAQIVPASSETVTALLQALKDPDRSVRAGVCESIGRIAAPVPDFVPAIIAATKDRDEYVRRNAVEALGTIGTKGTKGTQVLMALNAALRDKNHHVRWNAVEALGLIGKVGTQIPEIVSLLIVATRDEDHDVRFIAADALGKLGNSAAAALEPLLKLLKEDADENVRFIAAGTIGKIDLEGRLGVPALVEALKGSTSAVVRRFAAIGLGEIGRNAKSAVPDLLNALRDDDEWVRVAAAEALWLIDRNTRDTVGILGTIAANGSALSTAWAAEALRTIGPDAKAAVPSLLVALANRSSDARASAADALGQIGASASDAASALLNRLDDESGDVRVKSATALWKINRDPRLIPKLVQTLNSNNSERLLSAIQALGEIGPDARAATPALRKLKTRRVSHRVRDAAIEAVEKIEPPKKSRLPSDGR